MKELSIKEKTLLLRDLSARLPYGVIGEYKWKSQDSYDRELTGILYGELFISLQYTGDSSFKPYLRPLSSMTEEEKKEYNSFIYHFERNDLINYEGDFVYAEVAYELADWFNEHYFDYRGLIPMDLALEAPKDMYDKED